MNRSTALVSTLAVLGTASLLHATNARVESMGKHDTYFMDDVSVWTNPANANIYPNYLMGELGQMRQNGAINTSRALSGGTGDTTGSAFARYNTDPTNPWFGAIFAKSFASDASSGNRYPQVVIGGAFNRPSEYAFLLPSQVQLDSTPASIVNLYSAAKGVRGDGLIGFATASGILVGAKFHLTLADSTSDKNTNNSSLWATTFGINAPLAQGLDLEASFTTAVADVQVVKDSLAYESNSDLSWAINARAFLSVPAISGEIVPAVAIQQLDGPGIENSFSVRAGSGVNVSLDRGFFWVGADYTNSSIETRTIDGIASESKAAELTTVDENAARISFGIERNVWWDWFVLRVGGQKVFKSSETTGTGANGKKFTTSVITTNPEGDGTENDHVSFGFGLNIEDKLKVDAVVAEDILFTGGNLLGGPADHILSRVSATYSF
jgi:hypothetical protein